MRKFLYPAAGVAVLASGLAIGARPSEAASYAGHWKAAAVVTCLNSAANARVCGTILGALPVVGKKGTTLVGRARDNLVVAANGTFTDAGSSTISETAPGSKLHGCPGLSKLGSATFNGSCTYTWTGRGHVKAVHGTPIFYEDAQTLRFKGAVFGTLKGAQANTGLPTPAKAGTYSAAWAVQQIGAKQVPPGFAAVFVLTRSA